MDCVMLTGGTAANTAAPTTANRSTTFPRRALPMKKRKTLESSRASTSTSTSPSTPPAPELVSSSSSSSTQKKPKVSTDSDHDDHVSAALLLLKAAKVFPVRPGQEGGGSDGRDEHGGGGGGGGERRCNSPPRINDVLMTIGQARGEIGGRRGGGGGRRGSKVVVDYDDYDDDEDTRALLFHHIGNRRFRVLVEASLSSYFASSDEVDAVLRGRWPDERSSRGQDAEGQRGRVARAVIDSVGGNSPPGRFLVRLGSHSDDDEEVEDGSRWKVATGEEIERMVHSTFWAAGRYWYFLNRDAPEVSVEEKEAVEEKGVVEEKEAEVEAEAEAEVESEGVPEEEALETIIADPIAKSIRLNQLRHRQRRHATTALVEGASALGGKKTKTLHTAPFTGLLPTTFSRNQIAEIKAKALSSGTSSPSSAMTPSAKTRTQPSPPAMPSPTPPESARTSIGSVEGSVTAMAAKYVADYPKSITPPSRLKVFLNLPIEKFFNDDVGENASSKNDDIVSPPAVDPGPYVVPSNYDVLCGRGRSFFHHVGNRRFRIMIEMNSEPYKKAYLASLPSNGTTTAAPKDGSGRRGGDDSVQKLIDKTLHSLSTCDPPARFLGMDMSTGRWRALNSTFAQLKTEQTFFECLQVGQVRLTRQHEEERRRLIECQQREEELNLVESRRNIQLRKNHSEMQKQHESVAWECLIECEKKKILLELEQRMTHLCGGGGGGGTHQVAADGEMPQGAQRVLNNGLGVRGSQDLGTAHAMKTAPTQHSRSDELNLQSLLKQADEYQIPHQKQKHEISQLAAAAAATGMLQQLQQQEDEERISKPLFQAAFASALSSILSNNNSCGGGALVPQQQEEEEEEEEEEQQQQLQKHQKARHLWVHSLASSLKLAIPDEQKR